MKLKQIAAWALTLALGMNMLSVNAFATEGGPAPQSTVSVGYVDAAGNAQTPLDCTEVATSGGDVTWTTGNYVVNTAVTVTGRITVSGDVTLILADGAALNANYGITVTSGNSLTIYGQAAGSGSLTATAGNGESGNGDAGIGGVFYGGKTVAGTITINGGIITATGGQYGGAGIGGANGYDRNGAGAGGTVVINGGIVTAIGGDNGYNCGAGIGGGEYGAGANVTITGGMVTATANDYYIYGIGHGNHSTNRGSFTTTNGGNAIIITTGIAVAGNNQYERNSWSGIIFESDKGTVYGKQTLPMDFTIPEGKTLTVGSKYDLTASLTIPEGTTLTIPAGTTLATANNGKITNSGTLSVDEGGGLTGDVNYLLTVSKDDGIDKIETSINGENYVEYTAPLTVKYGNTLSVKATLKNYNDFVGWGEGIATTDNPYTIDATNLSPVTLAATTNSTAKVHPLTYLDQDGAALSGTFAADYPTNHTDGVITTLLAPTKAGYTFNGWFSDAACTDENAVTELAADDYTAVEGITLYAKWSITPAATPVLTGSNPAVIVNEISGDMTVGITDKDETTYTYTYAWYKGSAVTATPIAGAATASYAIPTDLARGTHTYTVHVTATRKDNGLTATADKTFTVQVTKKLAAGTVTMSDYTYKETPSTPTITDKIGDGTVTYYYNATDSNENGTAWSGVTATTLNAGTYYLYAEMPETASYEAFTTETTAFTVGQATGSITGKTTGGYTTEYTYTGSPIAAPTDSNFTIDTDASSITYTWYQDSSEISGPPADAGTYTLRASVAETTNYTGATAEDITVTIRYLASEDEATLAATNKGDNGWYKGAVTVERPQATPSAKRLPAAMPTALPPPPTAM